MFLLYNERFKLKYRDLHDFVLVISDTCLVFTWLA